MKMRRVIVIPVALGLVSLALGQPAEDSGKPYGTIPARNVFGLVPPPAPPSPESLRPPLPKITITGVTTILGNKRVLLKLPPGAAKPGEAAKAEQSFILSEGQREGDIEVVSIDEVAGSVNLIYGGTPTTLTLEKDGPKAPVAGGTPPTINPFLMGRPAVPTPVPAPVPTGVYPSAIPAPQAAAPSPTGLPGLPEGFRRPIRGLQQPGTVVVPTQPPSPSAPPMLPQ